MSSQKTRRVRIWNSIHGGFCDSEGSHTTNSEHEAKHKHALGRTAAQSQLDRKDSFQGWSTARPTSSTLLPFLALGSRLTRFFNNSTTFRYTTQVLVLTLQFIKPTRLYQEATQGHDWPEHSFRQEAEVLVKVKAPAWWMLSGCKPWYLGANWICTDRRKDRGIEGTHPCPVSHPGQRHRAGHVVKDTLQETQGQKYSHDADKTM